jgi:hypothetical protein
LSLFFGLVSAALPTKAENAAHDLANKFSGSAAPAASSDSDAQRKAYEAEMLERARQEAAERAAADADAAVEAENRQKELEAERQAEAQALAEKLKRADEVRKAKSAENRDQPSFKPALTRSDKDARPANAPSPVVVSPPAADKPAEVAKEAAPVSPSPVTAPKTAEPSPSLANDVAKPRDDIVPPPMALGRAAPPLPDIRAPVDPRVTVLLVMEPGTKGIRRFNKTADPILCEGDVCFVSNGAASPARSMPMRKALGPGNTFGKRAGACRSKLGCVFRGLTLEGSTPTIQPVDLKVLVHDRREPRPVSGDASCRLTAGRLSCGRTVVAPGYRAWIVPEAIAESAGAAVLEMAVTRGLQANPLREASIQR